MFEVLFLLMAMMATCTEALVIIDEALAFIDETGYAAIGARRP